jgi:hypothetical protein
MSALNRYPDETQQGADFFPIFNQVIKHVILAYIKNRSDRADQGP